MKNKPLVVYHGPACLDGIAAAACMYRVFGDDAEYAVGKYQSENTLNFFNRDVYLVDFSYSRQFMIDSVLPVANTVYLIDHHKTAIDSLLDLANNYSNFITAWASSDYSGAMLAWNFLHGLLPGEINDELPTSEIIEIIQDRDLWRFNRADTKDVTAELFHRKLDYKSMEKLLSANSLEVLELRHRGKIISDVNTKHCETLLKIARRTINLHYTAFDKDGNSEGEGVHTIDFVNAPPMFSSEIGNMIAQEKGMGGTYYDTVGNREFSLRSIGDIDVSAIAKMFGGGGHKNAAGFKLPLSAVWQVCT